MALDIALNQLPGYMKSFDTGQPWYVLAIFATIISMTIHGLLVGLGKAFALHELERSSYGEILQGAATLAMVIFLVLIVSSMDGFAVQYFFGTNPNPNIPVESQAAQVKLPCGSQDVPVQLIGDSFDLLTCRMGERAENFAELKDRAVEAAGWPLFGQSLYFSLLGLPVIQGGYFSNLFNEIETYRIIIDTTTNILVVTNVVALFSTYVKNNMLAMFLPLGLLLRSFHFTRGVGAFFISTALAFYFIFPILYIVTDPAYVKPAPYDVPPQPSLTSSFQCYPTFSGIVRQLVTPLSNTAGGGSTEEKITLDDLKDNLAKVYLGVVLHPFIVFSITLLLARQFMYLFGGESQDLLRLASKVI